MQFASNGYDFNYVLEHDGCPIVFAAGVYEPQSGRLMEVYTSEPGVQFYTGQRIDGDIGKDGKVYDQYAGLALETQHFPDSPNHPNFPSTELSPGQIYKQTTIYKFSSL
jgi:galactose mutarotase-like enzyme